MIVAEQTTKDLKLYRCKECPGMNFYDLRELRGYEFSISKAEKPKESVEIVNHFYIRNMNFSRDKNPCLSGFKVVCTKQSTMIFLFL